MDNVYDVGRGSIAVADMKARLAALRLADADWLDALWERNHRAILGEGFRYEYAEQVGGPVRPAR